jgi:hypothetical protein
VSGGRCQGKTHSPHVLGALPCSTGSRGESSFPAGRCYRMVDVWVQATGELGNPDLVTVGMKVPSGVICFISALAFHELTTRCHDGRRGALGGYRPLWRAAFEAGPGSRPCCGSRTTRQSHPPT